jgi:hypothetical protein
VPESFKKKERATPVWWQFVDNVEQRAKMDVRRSVWRGAPGER